MSRRAFGTVLVLAATLLCGASCQSIAGVEEYQLGLCGEYCDTVLANCTQSNQVYTDRATCMGICGLLEQGDSIEPGNSDTVACRLQAAREATPPGDEREIELACQQASPTGGGRCGKDQCVTYCDLFGKACADEAAANGCGADCCKQNCPGVPSDGNFNTKEDYDGDTLECRFVHLSSATVNPATHCSHARLAKPASHCTDDELMPPKPPTCDAYCNLVLTVCIDENAVYENLDQCLAVCNELDALGFMGESGDTKLNTVACRRYHTNNAFSDSAGHCSHAGPGGAGHCMDGTDLDLGNCESYCRLAEGLCASDFTANFADQDECMTACVKLDGSQEDNSKDHYSTATAADDPASFRCRLLELTRAAENPKDASHCAAAFGAAPCE